MADTRETLVRRNFEAYRDLAWMEDLEPRFQKRGIDGERMQALRQAWNEHAEVRDWAWWQQQTAHASDEQLRDEIRSVSERLQAVGRGQQQTEVGDYQQMFAEVIQRTPVNDKDKGIER